MTQQKSVFISHGIFLLEKSPNASQILENEIIPNVKFLNISDKNVSFSLLLNGPEAFTNSGVLWKVFFTDVHFWSSNEFAYDTWHRNSEISGNKIQYQYDGITLWPDSNYTSKFGNEVPNLVYETLFIVNWGSSILKSNFLS